MTVYGALNIIMKKNSLVLYIEKLQILKKTYVELLISVNDFFVHVNKLLILLK